MNELLLRRAQQGDAAAFEEIFTPLEGRIYRTCVHVLGPGEDAKDCAQEVLLRAFRSLKDFRGDCALESWVHRLCMSTCLDAVRKRKVRAAESVDALAETGYDPPSREAGPYEQMEKKERMALLRSSIAALPEDQRLAFSLTVLEEVPYEEAAEQLGVAVGTIKSRVNRAREKILKLCGHGAEQNGGSRVQQGERRAKNEL